MTPCEIADWLESQGKTAHYTVEWSYEQAAATIRAQAEALKIATEALEPFDRGDLSDHHDLEPYKAYFTAKNIRAATQALARIKEVGL